MPVVRTLGKNTLGDNDKMKVAMRDYDMSTHDRSTICRTSLGVGMLVPFCKILCQKGDIIDIITCTLFAIFSFEIFWITNIPRTSYRDWETDRKSTRLNSSHITRYRMPSSA